MQSTWLLQSDFLHLLSFHVWKFNLSSIVSVLPGFPSLCSGINRVRVSAPCWCRPALRAVATPCALRGEPGCSSHGFCPSQGALRVDGSVCGSAVAAHQPPGARSSPLRAGSSFIDVRLPKRSTPRRYPHYSLPLLCLPPAPSDQNKPSCVVWRQLLTRIIAGATKKIHFSKGHWWVSLIIFAQF